MIYPERDRKFFNNILSSMNDINKQRFEMFLNNIELSLKYFTHHFVSLSKEEKNTYIQNITDTYMYKDFSVLIKHSLVDYVNYIEEQKKKLDELLYTKNVLCKNLCNLVGNYIQIMDDKTYLQEKIFITLKESSEWIRNIRNIEEKHSFTYENLVINILDFFKQNIRKFTLLSNSDK